MTALGRFSAASQPCAQRHFTAMVEPNLVFESCSYRGIGDWRVTWDFGFMGRPKGALTFPFGPGSKTSSGSYSVVWEQNGVAYTDSGDVTLSVSDDLDDKGKLIKRHYWLKGRHKIALTKGAKRISQLSKLMGKSPRSGVGIIDLEVDVSDKPCKSLPPRD
jgi:hypothetical protein